MIPEKERSKTADRITEFAIQKYGELRNRKARPPLNQLILSVFYQQTSVRRATRALNELKREFVDWNELRVSHPVEVAGALSSARWAIEGSERVVWLLGELFDAYNRTNLGFLADLTPAQARSCLKGLPIVQRHLADEVLLLSLEVPVLPLSEHVARMCYRLGLLPDERATVRNQRALGELFEEVYYPTVHMFFCDHAAKLCVSDGPQCDECPLEVGCPATN